MNKNYFYTNSQRGFVSIYFILFITLLLVFSLIFKFIFYAAQSKDAFRTHCLTTAVELEKNIINYEKALFLLNIPSTALRLQLAQAYIALATIPWPANLAILVEIEEIELAQQELDTVQKNAILMANTAIATQLAKLTFETNKTGQKFRSSWSQLLNIINYSYPKNYPKLSIRPDSIGGLAPNYELDSDYKQQQRVELKWHNIFWLTAWSKKTLNIPIFSKDLQSAPTKPTNYELTCLIEAERTNLEWKLEISLDKR